MKKIWLVVIGVVLLLGTVGLVGCSSGSSPANVTVNTNASQTGVWVNGEGKINVAPDVAILTLGIEVQEASVADAQANASAAMDNVMQALTDQGIEEKDIQTQYFSIYQVTNWNDNKEEITGYRVTNTVTVKVRAIDKAGEVIDAAVTAGGDYIRVNGITFTVDEPADYYVQARELAISHAAAKAQQLAGETNIELGKVTYISESSYNYGISYRNYYTMEDAAVGITAPSTTTPVSIGELEITATVQIAYEIK